jgi:hypothetical protein
MDERNDGVKRRIKTFIAIWGLILLACLYGCSVIDKTIDKAMDKAVAPSEIKDGFNHKWLKTLSGEYNLDIPNSAVYQKGFYEPGQDFSVHMLFTVSAKDFDNMVGDGWTEDTEGHFFGDEWYTDLTDTKLPNYYVYSKQYTVLFFSDESKDGIITCVFVGWRPK